jgi:DNA topoisomerase-1
MGAPGRGRDKVIAAIVHLLETTMIRVGGAAYARDNHSFGLASLRARHVAVNGSELKFHFKGKSGKIWRLALRDRRIAAIVKTCQELPGQPLFQYVDDLGELRSVSSADVNAYLRQASDADITAKDFRTWAGGVLAAAALIELGPAQTQAEARKNLTRAICEVASRLGNTPTICRKCYIHPDIVSAYFAGELAMPARRSPPSDPNALRPEEAAVLALLRRQYRRRSAHEH